MELNHIFISIIKENGNKLNINLYIVQLLGMDILYHVIKEILYSLVESVNINLN